MADNPFSVRVPNVMEALMAGDQGYKEARGYVKEGQVDAARQQAANDIMQGGDPKAAFARLLSIGDDKGAHNLATVMHNNQTADYQNRSLAETSSFHKGTLGRQSAADAEAARHHQALERQAGSSPIKLGSDLSGDIYGVRDPSNPTGYRRIDLTMGGAPGAGPPPVGPAPSPGPAPPGQPPPTGVPGAGASLSGQPFLDAQVPPGMHSLIKKLAAYEMDPRASSISGGHREKILAAVAQYDPTYDANTFPSRTKAVKDFATGPQGNAVRSFDVATDHLHTMRDLAEAMQNGDVRLINSIRNKFKDQFGYDAPSNFDAAKSIVSAEITKAIIGGNSALADREELRAPLNNSKSFAQLAGVIDKVYKPLMAGQVKGLKKQYEETTGRKDFESRLSERTRSELIGKSGNSNITPPPAGFVVQ